MLKSQQDTKPKRSNLNHRNEVLFLKNYFDFKTYPLAFVLDKLLEDKTTKKNIIWATNSYKEFGDKYCDRFEMTQGALLGLNPILIQPRAFKSQEDQLERTKKKAEVFTPTWLVNKMINQIDEVWFGRKDVFNTEEETDWKTIEESVKFENKSWKKYVGQTVLEITCGEAPFIVSRYNAADGEPIPIKDRVGILDRKLRIINENVINEEEWLDWTIKAFKRIHGYEYQGDNLLIGRINLLMTFIEYYEDKWKKQPTRKQLTEISNIIAWNFWQMDGLQGSVPLGIPEAETQQPTLFSFDDELEDEKAPLCKIYDWKSKNKSVLYNSIKKEGNNIGRHFDVVIGNPPYQESDGGNKASAVPVYQKFINEAEKVVEDQMCLIIPDRWFAGGRGLDQFREQMKKDDEIKYLYDFGQASDCFPGMDISGGICYFIKDKNYHGDCTFVNHGASIDKTMKRSLDEFPVIIRSNAAVAILEKIQKRDYPSLSNKVSSQKPFGLRTYVKPTETGDLVLRWNKGKGPFKSEEVTSGKEWINKNKVIVSRVFFEHAGQASKDGNYRVLSVLEQLKPGEVCTETYIVVDTFDSEKEAENLEKYLKTKLVRYLILQVSSSIMVTRNSFLFVPELDFSDSGPINWNTSISDLDRQLYDLFNLSHEERSLIESTIKEME